MFSSRTAVRAKVSGSAATSPRSNAGAGCPLGARASIVRTWTASCSSATARNSARPPTRPRTAPAATARGPGRAPGCDRPAPARAPIRRAAATRRSRRRPRWPPRRRARPAAAARHGRWSPSSAPPPLKTSGTRTPSGGGPPHHWSKVGTGLPKVALGGPDGRPEPPAPTDSRIAGRNGRRRHRLLAPSPARGRALVRGPVVHLPETPSCTCPRPRRALAEGPGSTSRGVQLRRRGPKCTCASAADPADPAQRPGLFNAVLRPAPSDD